MPSAWAWLGRVVAVLSVTTRTRAGPRAGGAFQTPDGGSQARGLGIPARGQSPHSSTSRRLGCFRRPFEDGGHYYTPCLTQGLPFSATGQRHGTERRLPTAGNISGLCRVQSSSSIGYGNARFVASHPVSVTVALSGVAQAVWLQELERVRTIEHHKESRDTRARGAPRGLARNCAT
jgi:hypothetical protein